MGQENRKHKKWKIAMFIVAGILLAGMIACVVYVNDYYHAEDAALEVFQADGAIRVEQMDDRRIVFSPEKPTAGVIFYPGGKVEYTAYAPLLYELAEQGVLCVLIKMPCNLAVLDVNAADGIQDEFPEIEKWYIGGHSLGGSMAAGYAAKHTEEYDGLILFAAYSTANLSESGLKVISIYGSNDGVLNMEKYRENFANLPADTVEYIIEGGCHAQFGSYGRQKGDGVPAISGEEQRRIAVRYIMETFE